MSDELPLNDTRRQLVEGSPAWKLAEVKRFKGLSLRHHGLTTIWFATIALGVSRQRVHQLINEGRLPVYDILGKRLIPCDALDEFAALERSSGFRYASALA
jgi:excisionase family DNA binding protein